MASRTRQDIAEAYLEVWRDEDFDAIRASLRDDVVFNGPFVSLSSTDDVINAIKQLSGLVKTPENQNVMTGGHDVCIINDLVPVKGAPSVAMSEVHTVTSEKISSIRVIFDTAALTAIF